MIYLVCSVQPERSVRKLALHMEGCSSPVKIKTLQQMSRPDGEIWKVGVNHGFISEHNSPASHFYMKKKGPMSLLSKQRQRGSRCDWEVGFSPRQAEGKQFLGGGALRRITVVQTHWYRRSLQRREKFCLLQYTTWKTQAIIHPWYCAVNVTSSKITDEIFIIDKGLFESRN